MHETMAFDHAIERALELINFEETLVIVTADHSHVMTMAGYPSRGTDIRGILIISVFPRFSDFRTTIM
jgi:alkaline phosphatase